MLINNDFVSSTNSTSMIINMYQVRSQWSMIINMYQVQQECSWWLESTEGFNCWEKTEGAQHRYHCIHIIFIFIIILIIKFMIKIFILKVAASTNNTELLERILSGEQVAVASWFMIIMIIMMLLIIMVTMIFVMRYHCQRGFCLENRLPLIHVIEIFPASWSLIIIIMLII